MGRKQKHHSKAHWAGTSLPWHVRGVGYLNLAAVQTKPANTAPTLPQWGKQKGQVALTKGRTSDRQGSVTLTATIREPRLPWTLSDKQNG